MRVTLGIATFNRDRYLAEAVRSALNQDFGDYEVLVVEDGSTNPAIAEALSGFEDPRLRVVRHAENRGIAAAYNTIIAEARGEMIAMLGDDDLCLPDRLSRQVAIFDRFPDTAVVHGDAQIIDAEGCEQGSWCSLDQSPAQLRRTLVRDHNYIVDPTRMVHRRLYAQIGGYDPSYKLAQDFDLWLRAASRFRFRHCPGGPLIALRRHGENGSDPALRPLEIAEVQRAIAAEIERSDLRELVPELDWAVLDRADAERQALEALAQLMRRRTLPLPELAQNLHALAAQRPKARRPARSAGRLLIGSYGFNAGGGGTTVPRLLAKELVRRGWEVSVFYAAAAPSPSGEPYELIEGEQDGVRLLGVHNRPHQIMDLGNPLRELDDPPITRAFAEALDRLRPQVVHFHNLHNLGGALMAQAAARGIPALMSAHNYWLICPRAYLVREDGQLCAGPGSGERCAECVGSQATADHQLRLQILRAQAAGSLQAILAPSQAAARTLASAGYPTSMLRVLEQSLPHFQEIWQRTGSERPAGRLGAELTIAFIGSGDWHKGPHRLVQAAQMTRQPVRVRIHGAVTGELAERIEHLDGRGAVELCGRYELSELPGLLAEADVAALPSQWWDCAPLSAGECLAARLPLLVPRLGGLQEVVEDGRNGLHFNAFDSADLAAKIDRIAAEPGLLEAMQQGIAPPRSFSAHVEELEQLYAQMTAGGPPAHVGKAGISVRRPVVRWRSQFGAPNSLAKVSERVCERLDADLQRVDNTGEAIDPPLACGADVEVRHAWPPDFDLPQARRLALIQPWEYGALPVGWADRLRAGVDELWVPSEHVRQMYLAAGLEPERVLCIPNGVDLDCYSPQGEQMELERPRGLLRLLFVGALVARKGPDILLAAYIEAFRGRDDVQLIVKTGGAAGMYEEAGYAAFAEHIRSGALPSVQLIDRELSESQMAALYRACDVLVHPARGEGFALPVLEAMACGLPVVHTEKSAMEEFCPPDAGWRIPAERFQWPDEAIGAMATCGRPVQMEPDIQGLAAILRGLPEEAEQIGRAGRAAREAAVAFGWDEIASRYTDRLHALAECRPGDREPSAAGAEPVAVSDGRSERHRQDGQLRILATPAWRGADRLDELLAEWARFSTPDCKATLCLLGDPAVDGTAQELQQRLLATGIDFDAIGDVSLLVQAQDGNRDRLLHRTVDVYVPLHSACGGQLRLAAEAGSLIAEPGAGVIARLLARRRPEVTDAASTPTHGGPAGSALTAGR